jgi:ribosomal protein L18
MATKKKTSVKKTESALTAAQAVGTALGKLALKVGVESAPPAKSKKVKATPKKAPAKKNPK